MEDFFYFNISKNDNYKNNISNILIFLDDINKKINFTKINIKEKENDLIKFLLNKFKKLYLFQFMLNPNEDIQNALNNSLILLFNEISNNLNYNNNDIINDNYIDILKNKSIYKFLEELEENKDNYHNSSSKRLFDLNQIDIQSLKSDIISNNEYLSSIDAKIDDLYYHLNHNKNIFFIGLSSILIFSFLIHKY